jgi:hypothetical protein
MTAPTFDGLFGLINPRPTFDSFIGSLLFIAGCRHQIPSSMKSGYALVSSILVMASQKLTNCCVPAIALVTAVYCPPKPETSKSALQNRRDAPRQAPYFL